MNGWLEWKAYRKVECEITTEFGVSNRIMLPLRLVGGIDGFHTQIKTQDKIIKVKAEAKTIAYGKLLPEL